MNNRPIITRILSLAIAAVVSITTGFSEVAPPAAVAITLPVQRTLTSTDGRKIDVTITDKSATAIKGTTAAGKEFTLELAKLSAEDQAFIVSCKAAVPIGKKVLYVVNRLNIGDTSNVEVLRNTGFDVTLAYMADGGKTGHGNKDPIADFYGKDNPLSNEAINVYTANLADYDIFWKGTTATKRLVRVESENWDAEGLALIQAANKLDLTVVVSSITGLPRGFLAEGKNTPRPKYDNVTYVTVDRNYIIYNDQDPARGADPYDPAILAQVRAKLKDVALSHHRR